MDYIETVSGNVLEYNAMIFDSDWKYKETAIINYFTKSAKM